MTNQCKHVNWYRLNIQDDKWCRDCGAAYKIWDVHVTPGATWQSPKIAMTEPVKAHDPTPPIDWQARLEGVENFVRRIEGEWEERFTKQQLSVQHLEAKVNTLVAMLEQRVQTLEGDERENSAVAMHGHDDRINQLSDRVQKLQDIMIAKFDIHPQVLRLESKFDDMVHRHHLLRTRIEKLYSTFEAVMQACDSVTEKSSDES